MNDKAMLNGHLDVKPSIAVLLQQWRVLNDTYNILRYYFLLLTAACISVNQLIWWCMQRIAIIVVSCNKQVGRCISTHIDMYMDK